MIDFIIKSTLSLTVLLAVYHILLEKEKIHKFNRFYLLFSLVFSFSIPFLTIEVVQQSAGPLLRKTAIEPGESTMAIIQDSLNFWLIMLWSLYTIVTSILIIRFANNIQRLTSRIKSNPVVDYKNSKLVLLKEKILPHTFLSTIFVNESDYHKRKIEEELYTHELIHVTEKHTLDILLIEILKVIFWFNPIFIFYKKAIQLNHEFLADEKVVNSYNNVPFYQNLLLSVVKTNSSYYLASNLNYSITKKRLIMMTKTTSASRAMLKKLVLLPLFAGLTFLLCEKTVAQEKTTIKPAAHYFEDTVFKIQSPDGRVIAEKSFSELSTEELENIPPPPPPIPPAPTKDSEQNKVQNTEDLKFPEAPKVVELIANNRSAKAYSTDRNANETNPEFPGGMNLFYQFVAENFKVPSEYKGNGKVHLQFFVEKDGSLTNFKILKDLGYGTGDEVVRVLKLSPKWIPATINNKATRVLYTLPVTVVAE